MQSLALFLSLPGITAFTLCPPPSRPGFSPVSVSWSRAASSTRLQDTIVSPFDNSSDKNGDDPVATLPASMLEKGPLDLTWDNVELVLEDMRPYLIQDGGNVAITEIDGPVVRLELQGACGTCPSSTVSNLLWGVFLECDNVWSPH